MAVCVNRAAALKSLRGCQMTAQTHMSTLHQGTARWVPDLRAAVALPTGAVRTGNVQHFYGRQCA